MAVAEGSSAEEPPNNPVSNLNVNANAGMNSANSNPNAAVAAHSSPPSMSPPSMSPTSSSPPQRASPAPAASGSSAAAAVAAAINTTPTKTSDNHSSSSATTNAPRLQRVEFLYTSTPVEGCDLLPYVVLRTPSGEVKSAESIEAKTRGALSVQYRWNRCAATYTCASKHCFKTAQQQFVPLLKVAAQHVLPPDQFEKVIKQSFFCSKKCLQAAWPTLRQYIKTITSNFPLRDQSIKSSTKAATNPDSNAPSNKSSTTATTTTSQTQTQSTSSGSESTTVLAEQKQQTANSEQSKANDDSDRTGDENSNPTTASTATTKSNSDDSSDVQGQETKTVSYHDEDIENQDDLDAESVRAHYVIGRNDGVFQDPLPNPIKVTEVAFIRNYAPTADDVGHVLELVCRYVQRNSDGSVQVGPPSSMRSYTVLPTPEPPPERRMCNLSTGEMYSMSNRRPGTLRVMTYNILAEIYATKEHFQEKQCPSWALAWTFRKRRLISEMSKYDADILCLQEVQADHFEDHFQPYFSRKGYDSCFKGKTREAMGRRGKIDGCATFFRKDLYSLREQLVIEYNMIAQARCKEPRTLNRVLKGNVGQILILDGQDGSGPILVANTHLYWDPELSDVKLFQVDAFLQEMELLLQTRALPQDTPIVLAGDFNSTPDSSVYELLSTGACTMSKRDMPEDTSLLNTSRLRHNLRMRSFYSHLGGEPAYTNYTGTFKGVLDYVWYSTDSVVPLAILEIPAEQVLLGKHRPIESLLDEEMGIPNEQWSSDHIALVADFQLMKRTSTLPPPPPPPHTTNM